MAKRNRYQVNMTRGLGRTAQDEHVRIEIEALSMRAAITKAMQDEDVKAWFDSCLGTIQIETFVIEGWG